MTPYKAVCLRCSAMRRLIIPEQISLELLRCLSAPLQLVSPSLLLAGPESQGLLDVLCFLCCKLGIELSAHQSSSDQDLVLDLAGDLADHQAPIVRQGGKGPGI